MDTILASHLNVLGFVKGRRLTLAVRSPNFFALFSSN
jgi:hypothetical protein